MGKARSLDDVKKAISEVIAYYKAAATDGFTIAEVFQLTTKAIGTIVTIVENFGGTWGDPAKQATVMEAASKFYDEVIAPIDIPLIPNLIESRFVDPAIKSLWLKIVEGIVNGLKDIFNRTGLPEPTDKTDAPGGFDPY